MISNYVSSKVVINKLYRDLGINTEINEASVLEWLGEVLNKIGSYNQYIETSDRLEIIDGKCQLPNNFYKIINVLFNGKPLSWSNNSVHNIYTSEQCKIPSCCTDYNMYINGNYIITDITKTNMGSNGCDHLSIIYLGIPIDDDGYPLVPDDVYFMEACAKYVTYMLDYQEWRKGNLPDKVLNKSETDYLWYVGSAKGSANMPNAQQMDRLSNVWVRLIPNQGPFNNSKENLKRY